MADEEVTVDQEEQDVAELSDEERMMERLKEEAELHTEEIGTLRQRLTITVPRSIIDDQLRSQLDERRREETVPGFRRGRAPLKLVEKRFGKEIGEELSSRLVLSSYMALTERDDVKTLGDPMLLVRVPPEKSEAGEGSERLLTPQAGIRHIRLPDDGPLVYTCEVDVQPEFELPPLDGIAITRPKIEVTSEEIDAELKRMLALRGHFAPVDEKDKIKEDDLLVVAFKATVDGSEIKVEENAQLAARDMAYEGIMLTGLGKAVIGKKAGASVSFGVKIPDGYSEADLRGKACTVDLTIHDVKRLVIPEADEEFLESMGCESEEELRGLIQNELEAYMDMHVRAATRKKIDEYLLANTQLEIPEGISTRMTEQAVATRMIEKLQEGVPRAEIDKEMDALRTSAAEEAARELKLAFIMESIAEDREVTVTEEEINGVINDIARRQGLRFDRVRDELMKQDRIHTLYMRLRNDKIRDILLEEAKITDEPEKPAKATKKKSSKKTAKKTAKKKKTKDG